MWKPYQTSFLPIHFLFENGQNNLRHHKYFQATLSWNRQGSKVSMIRMLMESCRWGKTKPSLEPSRGIRPPPPVRIKKDVQKMPSIFFVNLPVTEGYHLWAQPHLCSIKPPIPSDVLNRVYSGSQMQDVSRPALRDLWPYGLMRGSWLLRFLSSLDHLRSLKSNSVPLLAIQAMSKASCSHLATH